MPTSWTYSILRFDDALQAFGVIASVIGVACTLYALLEFVRVRRAANRLQQLIATAHVYGQSAILLVQLGFLVINVLVLTLPSPPVVMYSGTEAGPWIMTVILVRKTIRLSMIVILAVVSIHRVWTFHRLLSELGADDGFHFHRRSSDR